jgi:hypothetical protein
VKAAIRPSKHFWSGDWRESWKGRRRSSSSSASARIRASSSRPGTDVMIFKLFSTKKWQKMAFFTQNKTMQKLDHNIDF